MDLRPIADHPLLRGLSDAELDAIGRVATERAFVAGEPLMTQGDFGHCLFLLTTGTADVSVAGEVVRSIGPGDTVGEIAVLASGRRTASVVATSPVQAVSLFKRDVWRLDREAPEAARRLRDALGEHLGATDDAASQPEPA
jgi:CRP-like cAMP-binding protein